MKASTNHKTPRNATFTPKPLSSAQLAGLELLLVGKTDQAVADAVGVDRGTVWHWRREHPVFMATLERRRAELYGTACERLRSLLAKAVENIAGAIESGDEDASWELLKAIRMYGNGTMNAIHEQDPVRLIRQRAESQAAEEFRQKYAGDTTGEMLDSLTNNQGKRVQAIMHELMNEYREPDD